MIVKTSLGEIPLTGHFRDRLKVLAITGAFAAPDEMSRLPAVVPEYDGVVARLPGNGTPTLAETSIPAFARAFDEVVDQLGPTVVVGISIGALVALGMRSPVAIVAVEPPLSTKKLWPLIPAFRRRLRTEHDAFIRNVFGITEDNVEERDYSSLLNGLSVPTDVIVGDIPLFPERALERFPSLVDEPERQRLAADPLVRLHVAPNSGHAVPYFAAAFMHPILLAACRQPIRVASKLV